ncbi:hypothetical protein PV10_00458 [Exophiala mesophila]|uniref:Uncharacterized protein n=1 Tax=Exophiala mesophila TaxID=212818 RepID=A0A0D1Y7D6_EXOME|nr:uncharacterized protein PV10_00458 [Exophiala mesophila]KIV96616.1 hypothetical protein PV10_00458 [Exophiala mesophila]
MATTKTDFSTPDIPMSEAIWYVSACTRINAPASLVFRTLRNTETWKDWNRWIPTVTITDQPDDEDDATIAEIEELVRNTSIAVNHDSEITDGGIMPQVQREEPRRGSITWAAAVSAHSGGAASPASPGDPSSPRTSRDQRPQSPTATEYIPPPVTRQRLASNASRISAMSNTSDSPRPHSNGGLSGAQKFQAAQEARKASLSSGGGGGGQTNGAGTSENQNSVMLEVPGSNSVLMPAPKNTSATALAMAQRNSTSSNSGGRRKSSASGKAERKRLHLNALYGEPSVRIQEGTRMTLHIKTKLPTSPHETRDLNVITTEVSRPDDPLLDDPSPAETIQRTHTHTVSKSGVYRLVWGIESKYNPPKSYPRFLLHLQRVHEIRPIVQGDGKEMCEYWQWEVQKGMLAKKSRKDKPYYEQRMQEWGVRLGEFCESMGGAVERRDFMVGY